MKTVSLTLLLFLVFFSCNRKEKPFFRGELKKIHFTKEYYPEEQLISIDSVGNFRVDIAGDLLIVSTYNLPYFTRIYDKRSMEYLGDYFDEGNGPMDFLQFAIVNAQPGFLTVDDRQNKVIKVIDLDQTVQEKRTQVINQYMYRKAMRPLVSFYVSDSCLLVKEFQPQDKGLYYIKYNPQTDRISGEAVLLYNYTVNDGIRNKISSISDCMKPDGTKLAISTSKLDYLDIVDLQDPENNIAVTTGNEVKSYDYLMEDIENWRMPDYYYGFLFCTDELIFSCYHNHHEKGTQYEVHAIGWDGDPKFKLIIPRSLMSLTVDTEEGMLYGLSDERLYRYNIKEILAKY